MSKDKKKFDAMDFFVLSPLSAIGETVVRNLGSTEVGRVVITACLGLLSEEKSQTRAKKEK